MDSVHVVAHRLARVKVETGSRNDLKKILIEGEKWLFPLAEKRTDTGVTLSMHLSTLARSSLAATVKQALDYRDYRTAAALAWINRPASLTQHRCDIVMHEGNVLEKLCVCIANRRWLYVIRLWPMSDWFHLLLYLLDQVSAHQMKSACGFLAQSMQNSFAVIPAIIAGDIELLEEFGEDLLAEYIGCYLHAESSDAESDVTEEADDYEDDYVPVESALSKQDQLCVDVWLNFMDALNYGLHESIVNRWRCYGITTTIENVLIPLLERRALSDATLCAFYELTTQIQAGCFDSCRNVFTKLASTSDFSHVTTFLPALRRAVAIAAGTLPSS